MGKYLEDMKTREYQCLVLFFLSSTLLSFTPLEEQLTNTLFDNFLEPVKDLNRKDSTPLYAKFSLRKASDPEDDVCFVYTGKPESLRDCNFNVTSKTFLVIHGWTVSGMFESWVAKLVTALHEREQNANVIVVDWLSTAQNHYTVAARNTKVVGQYIAQFINWMEATTNFPLENLHLIGYSLGAHVAGFAGSHASNKVGRITGLDPAGPDFEGAHAHRRLSPDDAHFVDVLHTFSRGSLGLSIGIQQPVGHVDIYPNGGGFQPGCNLRGALEKIANHGIVAMSDAVKCEHERSVHLFIDSLLNEQEAGQAYSCGSDSMFDRGVCLSCQKNRCNAIGYGASKVRRARSARMFTKTRASMPYRVYHYQLKIHFLCKANRSELEPTLTVSLYGTKGDAEDIQLSIKEKISSNKTHSFLLVTEKDIGELLMMKLKWEDSSSRSYSSLLKTVSDWWSGDAAAGSRMEVHKIRIKVGETQESVVLCLKNPEVLGTTQEFMFVKCKDDGKSSSKSHTMKKQ